MEYELTSSQQARARTIFGVAREIYMLGVLTAVYLNFYFMQVMVEIHSLPSMIVFVAPFPAAG